MLLSRLARNAQKTNSKQFLRNIENWAQCKHYSVIKPANVTKKADNNCSQLHLTSQYSRINSFCSNKYYSTERNDGLENWSRKLPSFGDAFVTTPSFYLMLKNSLSILFIQWMFDNQFNRKEFLSGTKRAIEVTICEIRYKNCFDKLIRSVHFYGLQVVSNMLANGYFEGLSGLVDESTTEKMRQIVGPMSTEQRKVISVDPSDIQWAFLHEIQFITKENTETQKVRFFVEIMVVFHMYSGEDLELSDIMQPNDNMMDELEKHYSVANYRFIKEFTKGVDDDWIINHILHVKPTDVMKEREKIVNNSKDL